MGDYLRLLQFKVILEEIKNDKLDENVLAFEKNVFKGYRNFEQ